MSLITLPVDLIRFICTPPEGRGESLDLKTLIKLSRVNTFLRTIALDIVMGRFHLDRPYNLHPERFRGFLTTYVVNLRLFFPGSGGPREHLDGLRQALGYVPDPTNPIQDLMKLKAIQVVALGSLDFLHFFVTEQPLEGEQISELCQAACRLRHMRMADMTLVKLQPRNFSPLPLLCSAYQSGHAAFIARVEGMIGEEEVQKLYTESHEKLFEAVLTSGDAELLDHFFAKLGKPKTSKFGAAHLLAAFQQCRGSVEQVLQIMLDSQINSQPEILKAAYATKDSEFIESCREKLGLNTTSDRLELSYACQTGDAKMMSFALTKINVHDCDRNAASTLICHLGNLTMMESLVNKNLFFLNNHSCVAALTSLFQKAKDQGALQALLNLIDWIQDNHYIVASTAYVNATASSREANFAQDQTRIRSEQALLLQIERGDLEAVKTCFPANGPLHLSSLISQKVLQCAVNGSAEHLNILLHLMQCGLKLTDISNDTLSDLFLAACKYGNLAAAKTLLHEKTAMPFDKGSRYMLLLHDHKGRFLEAALMCGNPEMTKLIETVAVYYRLGIPEILKNFESKFVLKQTTWDKLRGFWVQTKLFFSSILTYLKNWIR